MHACAQANEHCLPKPRKCTRAPMRVSVRARARTCMRTNQTLTTAILTELTPAVLCTSMPSN
eukprot:1668621-Pleurochrysis_carterae.AAC.2